MKTYLEVYPNRAKCVFWLLIFFPQFAFTSFFVYKLIDESNLRDVLYLMICFGTCSLLTFVMVSVLLYLLFTWKPAILIDDYGVHDNFSLTGAAKVKWEDITDVEFERKWAFRGAADVITMQLAESNSLGKEKYSFTTNMLGKGKEKIYGIIRARVKKGKL